MALYRVLRLSLWIFRVPEPCSARALLGVGDGRVEAQKHLEHDHAEGVGLAKAGLEGFKG